MTIKEVDLSDLHIYAVYATGVSSDYLLGYAQGNPKDIADYYEDKKGYGLKMNRVIPITVTKETAIELRFLRQEKADIEKRLKYINEKLK